MDEGRRLTSVETGQGRYYLSPVTQKWYPSVTTVVNHRDSEKWRKWREDPQNAASSQAAIERGNRMHSLMESYLVHKEVPESEEDRFRFEAIRPYVDRINKVEAIETPLWSDELALAGRIDCIGEYDRVPSVIDFKTSGKTKRREWILNYFHQATAYSYMWQERTNSHVKQLVILIACDDGSVQEFVENRKSHREGLAEVICDYWKTQNFEELQRRANDAMAAVPVRQGT